MRKILHYILIICIGFAMPETARTQIVNGNAFLEGNYIKLGLATNAAFGSNTDAPIGMLPSLADGQNAPICNRSKLGFVADIGRDGWNLGNPRFVGDYFLPGTPEEGWAVSFNNIIYNNNRSPSYIPGFSDLCLGGSQVPGTFTQFFDYPDKQVATWVGNVNGLKIVKRITLPKSKLYFITEVTFYNTTAIAMNDVYYMRNVDPDNEVVQNGSTSYTTSNKIEYQNPEPLNRALVSAKGTSGSYLGLGSIDCRAKVCIRGGAGTGLLANRSPQDVYNGVAPRLSTVGANNIQDCGIAIAFKMGTLNAGDSLRCAFAYILLQEDLEEALNKTAPEFEINGTIIPSSGGYANCSAGTLPINILNGSDYSWTWSPATGLNTTVGTSVIYTNQPGPITYNVSGPDPVCGTNNMKITIYPPSQPLARFNFDAPCGTTSTVFTNQSLTLAEPNATYTWDFGDGITNTQVSPTHTYLNYGTYNVTLTIHTNTISCGGDTVITKPVTLRDGLPPVIDFNANNICRGIVTSFSGTTNLAQSSVASYAWTISDGSTYSTQNINHVFNTLGSFDVTFEVTSTAGCTTKLMKTITVDTKPQVDFNISNGCSGKALNLVNVSNNVSGAISQWDWNFGNSTSSNLQNPLLVYTSGGTYIINLTATTANGCSSSTGKTVNVESLPIADFIHSPACPRAPVLFTNSSSITTGNIVSYEWNFDNGITSTLINPTIIFNADRNYRVTLKAISANGCESPLKTTTVVIKSPVAYAGKDSLVFKNSSFNLRGKNGPLYLWSPGIYLDDPTKANPVANIPADQVFTLTVTNESGCSATDAVRISVFADDDIYVPGMFTPNRDGKNDLFRPIAPPGVIKSFEVYNRWGQKIYSSPDQSGWNGKIDGIEQPAGVYVWFLKAVTRKGETFQKKGTVVLSR